MKGKKGSTFWGLPGRYVEAGGVIDDFGGEGFEHDK